MYAWLMMLFLSGQAQPLLVPGLYSHDVCWGMATSVSRNNDQHTNVWHSDPQEYVDFFCVPYQPAR